MKSTVLIVDDIDTNRMILEDMLAEDYEILEAANGLEALDILFFGKTKPKAVLLDIVMPELDGYQVLKAIRSNAKTNKIPVLFITAEQSETRGITSGANDYIYKPFNRDAVKARLIKEINLYDYQNELERLVEQKTEEVTKTYTQTLDVIATFIEYRNLESGTHIKRVKDLTELFVGKLLAIPKYNAELTPTNYYSMIKATALHDIGKIGISDSILLKPGKLSFEEFEEMKKHAMIGSNIIDDIKGNLPDHDYFLKHSRDISRSHHERWDGNGYPEKIAGEDIPLSARIVSIVDVFDALVNPRCYKPEFSYDDAFRIMNENRGTQFDPVLLDVFFEMKDIAIELEKRMKD